MSSGPGPRVAVLLLLAILPGCGGPKGDAALRPLDPEVPAVYTVRLPDGYDPGSPYPLLVALHGHNQSEDQVAYLWDEGFFYMPAFILVAIRGPFHGSEGYAWYRRGGGDVDASTLRQMSALTCERLVLDVVAEVEEEYRVDPDRRTLMGISQGGGIAYYVGLRNPDVFSGIATLSAAADRSWEAPVTGENAAGMSVFIGMGRRESPATIRTAEEIRDRFRAAGANVRYHLHDAGHVTRAEQVRAMQNFLGLAAEHAPEDDMVYEADGSPHIEYPPGFEPEDEFYEEDYRDDEPADDGDYYEEDGGY